MLFSLSAHERLVLTIEGNPIHFQAVPHPNAPELAHSMESPRSVVWHLQEISNVGGHYGLKLLLQRARGLEIENICRFVARLRNLAGLESCDQICLTHDTAGKTIDSFPELEFSVLMPWLSGTTWFDAHAGHPRTRNLSKWQCLHLATSFAEVLATLENQQLSHYDLGPHSVLVDWSANAPRTELLGVEHIYGAHLPVPYAPRVLEYRHRAEKAPGLASHRFPGALLIAEILSWHDDEIKKIFQDAESNDSLFTVDELQDVQNPKFCALLTALRNHHSDLAALLETAWTSATPEQAPTMQLWVETLERVSRTKIEYAWMPPPPAPQLARQTRCWDTGLHSNLGTEEVRG
jgi:hypothetical protein